MSQTSREIVQKCLTFNSPERIPRHLWTLPWAEKNYPDAIKKLNERYPGDFGAPDYFYRPSQRTTGDPYSIGQYTDEWGCVFKNLQAGVIGEVRDPMLKEISDWQAVTPPYEQLSQGKTEIQKMYDDISRSYEKSDKFMMANMNPRPWERYQFIRGTENAMIDIMMSEKDASRLLQKIHEFYLYEIEMWVKSFQDLRP
jgi:uroporphyrinogen decarboxylase